MNLRPERLLRLARGRPATLVVGTLLVLEVALLVADPFNAILVILLGVPVPVVVVLAALGRGRTALRDSVGSLVLCAAMIAMLFVDLSPVRHGWLEVRVHMAASGLQDEARRAIADPHSPAELDGQKPVVGRVGRSAVVGWRWEDVIPFKSYGPVFDPDGLLRTHPSGIGEYPTFTDCEQLFGVWYYCRLY